MRTARFWTGLALVAVVPLSIFSLVGDLEPGSSSPLSGRVLFRGRPVAGGMIFFTPMESDDVMGSCATIDEDGYFECSMQWPRGRAPGARLRIDVRTELDIPPDPTPVPGGEGPALAGPDAEGSSWRVVRASAPPEGGPPAAGAAAGRPAIPGGTRILQREVWLTPEPAYLEIDARD